MVFVMILIRINSSETSASCAAGVICFFIYYSHLWLQICENDLDYSRFIITLSFDLTVPHEIVTIETFFSKFSLCAVRKLDIFSERNVFRKHKICEKFLNARLQKSVHIEA